MAASFPLTQPSPLGRGEPRRPHITKRRLAALTDEGLPLPKGEGWVRGNEAAENRTPALMQAGHRDWRKGRHETDEES